MKVKQENYQINLNVKTIKLPELNGWAVFRSEENSSKHKKPIITEGFCNIRNRPKPGHMPIPKNDRWILIDDQCLEDIRMHVGGCTDDWKGKTAEMPFTEIAEGRKDEWNLVRYDIRFEEYFDTEGKIYPRGKYVDYISWHMRDGSYDLKKAHAILKDHPHVQSLSEIQPVPYYNRSFGCSAFICFHWVPDRENYQRVWDIYIQNKTLIPKIVFDLDLLGLRKGGAAKYNSFYAEDSLFYEEDGQ